MREEAFNAVFIVLDSETPTSYRLIVADVAKVYFLLRAWDGADDNDQAHESGPC
jgi:hypothetical protein